ncbi:hypothetical protein AVT43_gp21 [Polaribacter phage P12002L]|uniref:Uncharacterized protein n=2 Tax=Incheonvirus TaxID=2976977 RepID=A0A0F7IKK4_9CAUD|nr:hypothetical protein AVT42_gp21 [Polaribacter phage P12002S]YP_009209681.1 hypothetical protein AVT43_gp21 [Polaribacter phage P12002L]AKG94195.1 hypothetical protein P12002L_0021 [Polaribacter phage P12002L]AKG94277.1 hypothetical protein P12002S_0021 [Polaribacter phage P12002S]
MATIADIGNLVNCGVGVDLGTGSKGCEAVLKATTSLWLTPKGSKFDKTKEFTQEYIAELQAERKLIVLSGIKEFTTNKEENVKETDADGTISVTRKGLYAFNVKFKKGFSYQAALSSLDSFGAYDVLFVDQDGNVLGTVANDESLKGITTGMIDADGIGFATFSTSMMQGFTFQFLDPSEVDSDYFFISNKELDWKPQKQEGVNEVVLSYASTPADSGTTITVKAKLKQGGKPFTGAAFGDFIVKINGVTSNPTASSEVDGVYTLTISSISTNDVITVALYDNANNRSGISVDEDIFKSATISATVV